MTRRLNAISVKHVKVMFRTVTGSKVAFCWAFEMQTLLVEFSTSASTRFPLTSGCFSELRCHSEAFPHAGTEGGSLTIWFSVVHLRPQIADRTGPPFLRGHLNHVKG